MSIKSTAPLASSLSANGAAIPTLGYGTYVMHGPSLVRMIQAALKAGFRPFDTGQVYGNESAVGERNDAVRHSRTEVFITTKVWIANSTLPDLYDRSMKAFVHFTSPTSICFPRIGSPMLLG